MLHYLACAGQAHVAGSKPSVIEPESGSEGAQLQGDDHIGNRFIKIGFAFNVASYRQFNISANPLRHEL